MSEEKAPEEKLSKKEEESDSTMHEFEPEDKEGHKTGFRNRISSMTER
ncbi:MAG: hypothetical protein ACP5FU_05620 [Nitrososphaeria archaeon]